LRGIFWFLAFFGFGFLNFCVGIFGGFGKALKKL
jgi:hypothetical protein